MNSIRVFIITQDEPVYAPLYLTKIIEKSRQPFIGITALSPAGRQGWVRFIKERLMIYGLRDSMRAASVYGYCRLRSWLPRLTTSCSLSVRGVAARYAVPCYPCTNVNDPTFMSVLKSLEPDVVLSVGANQRFKAELLNTPRLACLNVHSALLPRYRGMDGLFWALVHGETEVGVTVHLMSEVFDAGPIVEQRAFTVAEQDSLHDLYFKAIEVGSSLVATALAAFASGNVTTTPNPVERGGYFSAPTREAVAQFRQRGRRFF